eukprot:TRINITY_DN74580_c0_g1_i1.p1 TRINITY_DN74580_c0_g1~~TRINITY_DN74580_c0_g1_i1.p1  ORF type:complete len:445 (+),score=54.11 TRINITY_DN74580_c0_g1_i1:46-1380(+)
MFWTLRWLTSPIVVSILCMLRAASVVAKASCSCSPTANVSRVLSDLRELRRFGAAPDHPLGVRRQALTKEDLEAREWLANKMESEASLTVHLDGLANMIGVHDDGSDRGLLLLGSHTDTQPRGGWLDGALGVIYALEAARALLAAGCQGRWAVVNWNDEEGRFGVVVGSSSFVGQNGITKPKELLVVREAAGLAQTPLLMHNDTRLGKLYAYFEAHIEQGKRLEDSRTQIAVVTTIVGLWQYRVTFVGQQNHAGTTPMATRKDAGLAAMRFATALDERFQSLCQGKETVWTFGSLELDPGAPSIVPGSAVLTVQFRDPDNSQLLKLEQALYELVEQQELQVTLGPRSGVSPAPMAPELQRSIEQAAALHSPRNWTHLHSGAVHDATNLAHVVPVAMMFVPSIGGISHNFDENTADDDIAVGSRVYVEAAASMLQASLGEACAAV